MNLWKRIKVRLRVWSFMRGVRRARAATARYDAGRRR